MKVAQYVRIIAPKKINTFDMDQGAPLIIDYIVFKLEQFYTENKQIELFFQCECGNFGGSLFNVTEEKIPEEIIKEMETHVNFKHGK